MNAAWTESADPRTAVPRSASNHQTKVDRMKQFLDRLLSRAAVRWTLLALIVTAAAASIAWSTKGKAGSNSRGAG